VRLSRDLDEQFSTSLTRLCHRYLGPAKITPRTSQWQSGKATSLSLLLDFLMTPPHDIQAPSATPKGIARRSRNQKTTAADTRQGKPEERRNLGGQSPYRRRCLRTTLRDKFLSSSEQ
jgi:hypothetical protein